MKKVTPNERRQSSSDGRGDLLSEIRTGKQLKKVRKQLWALKQMALLVSTLVVEET